MNRLFANTADPLSATKAAMRNTQADMTVPAPDRAGDARPSAQTHSRRPS
jgi:hypothetical protein